jgi:transcriptional regulator with XRE-family HTH domain
LFRRRPAAGAAPGRRGRPARRRGRGRNPRRAGAGRRGCTFRRGSPRLARKREDRALERTTGTEAGEATGSRIRHRRLSRNLRQAELALKAGISASYLNLIEHNKRRIGGKLLVDIARALEVEPSTLTRGADAVLIGALGAAAASVPDVAPERDRVEEFASRFPGWAALIATQARRLEAQERAVEALSDRLTHDPFLNASLHDVLSTVTAIRSTAAILNEGDDLEPAWRHRFHRNLYEDSRRLAGTSQALVAYLDRTEGSERVEAVPLDEIEAWFDAASWSTDAAAFAAVAAETGSDAGRALAERWRLRFAEDAAALPAPAFAAARAASADPAALAADLGTGIARVLRRWALDSGAGEAGLVVCDGSGAPVFRKSAVGFAVPSFGAGCPLWPLYAALARPGAPVRAVVEQAGRLQRTFLAYAVAEPAWPRGLDGPVLHEATMLLLPDPVDAGPPQTVGPSCRVCSRRDCPARREPSVLGES